MKPLVILDRDGVINVESKYFIKSPEEWIAIPNSLAAIVKLNRAGFIVCVATNQSGVARGLFTVETLGQIHAKMLRELAALGGTIDEIIFCPHAPDEDCDCRKPKPGMIKSLLSTWHATSQTTWIIGDSFRDLQAGLACGCQTILVKTGNGRLTLKEHPELLKGLVYDNLHAAVDFLCDRYAKKQPH